MKTAIDKFLRKLDPSTLTVEEGSRFARWLCLSLIVLKGFVSLRLQHLLTLFTMAIGAVALSATLFVGDGALKLLWLDLDRLMGDQVIVSADAGPSDILLKKRKNAEFTQEDFSFVRERLLDARYVLPRFFARSEVASEYFSDIFPIDGIVETQESDPAFTPLKGRRFSESARAGLTFECMLTESGVDRLNISVESSPTIRIASYRFRVVGVVEDPPESDRRFQARAVMPYSIAQHIWGKPNVIDTLVVSWRSPDQAVSIVEKLRKALDECRAPDAYYLSSSSFKIAKRKSIVSNFMVFGIAQALFCILIASIGIVNVMLANVVRRAREFAIRITMGARHDEIMMMVLTESFLLGLLGAVIGILLGAWSAEPLCRLFSAKIEGASQLQPYISLKGILLPLLVCSVSGLVAGIVPAVKAGRMDILSILRAE